MSSLKHLNSLSRKGIRSVFESSPEEKIAGDFVADVTEKINSSSSTSKATKEKNLIINAVIR
jgi:hypothetical protein